MIYGNQTSQLVCRSLSWVCTWCKGLTLAWLTPDCVSISCEIEIGSSVRYWTNLQPIISTIHEYVFRACREQREHFLFMKEKSCSASFCSIFKVNLPSNLFSTQSTAASNSCCTSVGAMLDVNRVALRSSSPWARLPVLWLVPYLRRKCCLGGHANFLSEVESRWNESMGIPRPVTTLACKPQTVVLLANLKKCV